MDKRPLLDDPVPDSGKRTGHSLIPRPQYIEAPYAEIIDDSGPSLFLEYWDIVRRRWATLALAAVFGFLAALLFTLPQTLVYRARASLEIQNLNENFLNLRDVNPTTSESGSSPPEYDLQTQVQILQSESVLERVVEKLHLAQKFSAENDPSRLSAWRKVLGLPGSRSVTREDLLHRVAKNLTVQAGGKTRLVEIFYNSTDPQLAADFANALAAEFIEQNLDARWRTTQQTGEWLTWQMEDVRIKLERAEDELQSYANTSGLIFTSEKDNIAEEKLRQLQQELSRAQADRVAAQSRFESASTAPPESLPEVLDDKTLGDFQVKLTDLRRQLAELSSALTPAHPAVKKVQAQIIALESALESKRANIVQRIHNEFQAAQRRENLLARNFAAQAQFVSEQAAKVAHYNILKREVDTNRDLYDSMLRSVQEAGISSALRASNVRVVDAAHPPSRPYKPSLPINSALGLMAGAFFGFAFTVMRERADRSIHAPGEAGLSLGVSELGVIPCAAAARSRFFAYYRDTGHETRDSGRGNRDTRLATRDSESGIRNPANGPITLGLSTRDPRSGTRAAGVAMRPCFPSPDPRVAGPPLVELASSRKSPSALAESFRATLTSILFSGENGDRPRVIVVTSAGPGEGKTTVASNLALALADTGSSVLLIDGDLRKGRLHEIFQVSNAWGLSDVLAGGDWPEPAGVDLRSPDGSERRSDCSVDLRSTDRDLTSTTSGTDLRATDGGLRPPIQGGTPLSPAKAYVETPYPRLWLLPAGPTPPSIASVLHSPRAAEFLHHTREEFHTVIIDTPPMLNMADARVLGKIADGVVLVVRAAQTTREAAAATQRLREDGSRVLGTVLNEWDPRRASHYGYGYSYYTSSRR